MAQPIFSLKNSGCPIVGGSRPKRGGDLAPGKRSKENLAPMRKTLSGVCRYCKLASSSKDTKQPLKFQRVFLCYMAQSKKSHYKENIVKK